MRKVTRMLVLALMILVVPGANALQMDCVSGIFVRDGKGGWKCTYWAEGTHCMICYAYMEVTG